MISRLTIAFLSIFLLGSNALGENLTPEQAKTILDKALKLQETRSYTSVTPGGEGIFRKTQKVFQKLNSDGSTYRRIETIGVRINILSIKNSEGLFYIFGNSNIALKTAYEYKYKKYDKGIKYEIKTGYYKKIPCYIITQKIPCNEDSFALFMKNEAKEHIERNGDKLRAWYFKHCIPVKVYYIGKNDNFIYKKLKYDKSGKLHSEFSIDNVNLNPVINDNIFQIPPDCKITICKTQEEYRKVEMDIVHKLVREAADKLKNK